MGDFSRGLPEFSDAARRALPTTDATIDTLPCELRARIAAVWLKRAEAELGAGGVFATIARGLIFEPVPREVVWLASRAVCDEIRHAELCLHLARRYAGEPLPRPAAQRSHETRSGPLIHAVVNGAINETIASAFLKASLEAATSPLARAVLRELLSDEIDHARIGWAVLGDASARGAEVRAMVQEHLPSLVGMVRELWMESARAAPDDLPREHGCLAGCELAVLVDDALRTLVLPGFAHVGVDPRPAEALLGVARFTPAT